MLYKSDSCDQPVGNYGTLWILVEMVIKDCPVQDIIPSQIHPCNDATDECNESLEAEDGEKALACQAVSEFPSDCSAIVIATRYLVLEPAPKAVRDRFRNHALGTNGV